MLQPVLLLVPAYRFGEAFLQRFGRGEGEVPFDGLGRTGPGGCEGFLDLVEVELIGLSSQGGNRLADAADNPWQRAGATQDTDMRTFQQRAGHFAELRIAGVFRSDGEVVTLAFARKMARVATLAVL